MQELATNVFAAKAARDMRTMPTSDGPALQRILRTATLIAAIAAIVGCGPSKEELLMRAAMRSRPQSASQPRPNQQEEAAATRAPRTHADGAAAKSDSSPIDPASTADPGSPRSAAITTKTTDAAGITGAAAAERSVAGLNVQPISDRQPDQPLSQSECRAHAIHSITRISEAIMAYFEDNHVYPRTFETSPGGLKSLSWRVKLLPYLGYDELYQQFDFSKRWDMEPNRSLLEYIPPEFVSPERFDSKTNFQLPAHRSFMFGSNHRRAAERIEDGSANTIMLVEVPDQLAVPWTAPDDFIPQDPLDFRGELQGLRSDGTFAAWANGWPTLLPENITAEQLRNAFTHESGDGQIAGATHQNIRVELTSSPAGSDATIASVSSALIEKQAPPQEQQSPVSAPTADAARSPMPDRSALVQAQERLREIYRDRLGSVATPDGYRQLAVEMLGKSAGMSSDLAGAYALQDLAMKVACEGADVATLLSTIDARVRQFDVDAYETNVEQLIGFGRRNVARQGQIPTDELLFAQRSVVVIHTALIEDDYDRAKYLVAMTSKFLETSRIGTLDSLLSRLRSLLRNTQREYLQMTQRLAEYRQDPSNDAAAAEIGLFLCFHKGDWSAGLPLLAQGGNAAVREAASADLRGAELATDQASIADTWWDLAQRAEAAIYKQGALDRARFWYRLAIEEMPHSLGRMHVRARLDALATADPGTPLTALQFLARELKVELGTGLSELAVLSLDSSTTGGP